MKQNLTHLNEPTLLRIRPYELRPGDHFKFLKDDENTFEVLTCGPDTKIEYRKLDGSSLGYYTLFTDNIFANGVQLLVVWKVQQEPIIQATVNGNPEGTVNISKLLSNGRTEHIATVGIGEDIRKYLPPLPDFNPAPFSVALFALDCEVKYHNADMETDPVYHQKCLDDIENAIAVLRGKQQMVLDCKERKREIKPVEEKLEVIPHAALRKGDKFKFLKEDDAIWEVMFLYSNYIRYKMCGRVRSPFMNNSPAADLRSDIPFTIDDKNYYIVWRLI